MKTQIKNIIDTGPFVKTRAQYGGSEAYIFAFCYPKSGPVLIKGMQGKVFKEINKLGKCHYEIVWFGGVRQKYRYWQCNVKDVYLGKYRDEGGVKKSNQISNRKLVNITFFEKDNKMRVIRMRKFPRRFIKEFDNPMYVRRPA